MTGKAKRIVWMLAGFGSFVLLFLCLPIYLFFLTIPGFDTQSNHLELKNHRDKYEAIVAAVLKQPLPKEGSACFLLSPPGSAIGVKPCPVVSASDARAGGVVEVEVKLKGRTLIWITTFPGGHFGQYYLVYCSSPPVIDEDFGFYRQGVQLDEHWWAVEDHSG